MHWIETTRPSNQDPETLMKRQRLLSIALPLLATLTLFSGSASATPGSGSLQFSLGSHRARAGYGSTHCSTRPRNTRFGRYTRRQSPRRAWIPGRYEFRPSKVWVPGTSRQVWCPPVFETRLDHCGVAFRFQVSVGYYRTVTTPGYYETRRQRVWCAGDWSH